MTDAYKDYRAAVMESLPYAVSRLIDGKYRYYTRTDNPEKFVESYYGNSNGLYPIRIIHSKTRKVVFQN